jgi:putative ABC transport system permease protein
VPAQELEELWNGYETGFPMEFRFLDDVISRLYTAENVQGKIFTLFSIVCVTIACIGIFGLAAFMNAQRKKEVSIRKILGASFGQLSLLLSSDLLKLVLIANVITIPIVYFAIQQWSVAFPYRAPISPMIFLGGATAILVLSAMIVLFNATKAAVENPADSLRSE